MGLINNIQGKRDFTIENEKVIQGMKRFFYNMPSCIDIFDKYGKLIWSNKKGLSFWGKEAVDKIGVFNILSQYSGSEFEFVSNFNKALLGHVTTSKGTGYHFANDNKIANKYHVETIFSPVFSNDGDVSHVVAISSKTEFNHINSNPENNYKKSNELNETNAFLRNISHELRTPLNWIIGFSDLIKSEQDIMKIKAYNEHINKGGKLMLSSIEMLIDISMLEKKETAINKKSFSIISVLEKSKALLLDEIRATNNAISVRVKNYLNSNNGNFTIVSDEDKLKKVLNSLIQNSLKFTKEGFIEIGCISMQDKNIMFYVKDSGIGISGDIKSYINDLFTRKDEKLSSILTGKGLGLSIVKKYINTLGGNIWLDSESKKGTTFYFTIKNYAEINDLSTDEDNFNHYRNLQIQYKPEE